MATISRKVITLHGTGDAAIDTAAINNALEAQPSTIRLEGGFAVESTICLGETQIIGGVRVVEFAYPEDYGAVGDEL